MIQKANEYIERNRIRKEEKPVFHVTPPVGWMNDPNGFSVYNGKIHLFYQFHPYTNQWGPMHWGHQVSEDMMRWEELPVALAPEKEYDAAGCFSGSGIETEEGHVLVYTGVKEIKAEDGSVNVYQNQCVAIGDGVSYHKIEKNPVVDGEKLPEGFSRADFRDPKVWKDGEQYYMVAGNLDENNHGQIVLFSSNDLREWKYEGVLAHSEGVLGRMWECPDFFPLDKKQILICSPQSMGAQKLEFHNGHNSVYFVGDYNKETGEFVKDAPLSLDYGLDFYAPQTTGLPDGRRILIGWMQSWDASLIPEEQKWNGMMTLPRELSLVNNQLIQKPIRELKQYHSGKVTYEKQKISGTCQLDGIKGRTIDMSVEIAKGDYQEFCIEVAHNEAYTTYYRYNPATEVIEVDRTYSGVCKDVVCQRKMQVKEVSDTLKLRFILDRNSVELFVNDGRQVSSTVIYTPQEADEIVFSCDGETEINVIKYDIQID